MAPKPKADTISNQIEHFGIGNTSTRNRSEIDDARNRKPLSKNSPEKPLKEKNIQEKTYSVLLKQRAVLAKDKFGGGLDKLGNTSDTSILVIHFGVKNLLLGLIHTKPTSEIDVLYRDAS